ncbi:MAG: hypothetical protein KKD38_06340, partial [Candidatus Delongbacteria bacterium]|nr:hypothetical protein [Candidatus Delongbacteria bacterium]
MKRVITTVGTSIYTNEIKNFDSSMHNDYTSLLGKTYSENRVDSNSQIALRLETSLKKLIIG